MCDLNHLVLSSTTCTTNKLVAVQEIEETEDIQDNLLVGFGHESGDIDCSEHGNGDAATSTYTPITTSTPDISTSIDYESASFDEHTNSTNSSINEVGTKIDQSDFGSIPCDELDGDLLAPAPLLHTTSTCSTDSNLYSVIDELTTSTTDHDSNLCDEHHHCTIVVLLVVLIIMISIMIMSWMNSNHHTPIPLVPILIIMTTIWMMNCQYIHVPLQLIMTPKWPNCHSMHVPLAGEADADTCMSIEAVVLMAVLEAMTLTDKVSGSQDDFMRILEYGKGLYCQGAGNSSLAAFWPRSWQSAIRLLEKHGYKNPKDYYVCLSGSHPCSFDIFDLPNSKCRLCGAQSSACIKYSYLPLRDKIVRCQDSVFCQKMTAHWRIIGCVTKVGIVFGMRFGMEVVLLNWPGFGIPLVNGYFQLFVLRASV